MLSSLKRKLPLLISALLSLVVVAVCWSAYHQMEEALIRAESGRLASTTERLADMLEESPRRLRRTARQLAQDAGIARFLAHRADAARFDVEQRLSGEQARASQATSVSLWSRDRERLLSVGPLATSGASLAPQTPAGQPDEPKPGSAWVGPLVRADSGTVYQIVAPVLAAAHAATRGAPRDTVGFVVLHRRITSGQGAQRIGDLIGSDATLLIGNAGGGPWTGLSRGVAGPSIALPVGVPTEYAATTGERVIGVAMPIEGTPWRVLVQIPRAAALAPARHFLLGVAGIAVVLVGLGAIGAWVLSNQVTAPLVELTRAAQDLAGGDYARRVSIARRDELGSLGLSFNSMAAQVEAATRELRVRAAERDAERRRLAAIIDQMPAAVLIAEAPSGAVVLGNGHVERIFGCTLGAMMTDAGYTQGAAYHADGRALERHEWPLARAVHAGERVYGEEYRYPRPDAPEAWVRVSAGPIRDRDGEIVAGVLIAEDVSARKALEAQLAHQAFHDALTGLANRALFRDRVERALARGPRAPRSGSGVAVLFLDLDDFKTVNDSLGHGEGDRLLVQVAARLLNATRGCDTVARLGGDEFAVLLENVREDGEALVVANRILNAFTRPVAVGATELVVRASVGIARAGDADDAEALLRNADVAMYRAKARSKGSCMVFAPEMYEALRDRVALEGDLRHGLDAGEFHVAYQPIVDLATEEVLGVEALARWQHPARGRVSPASFIPVAEASGLILRLGRWVLGEACRQAAAWQRAGAADLYVAVNISGRQLQHPQLVADVASVLQETGLRPETLLLEITESVVMEDSAAGLRRLHELKALGVRLAIDDFGTGYSSLSYLQRLPVDVLKIDKAFVDRLADGASDAALAHTIIALGETLALRTVAEGIETAEQQSELRALGCRLGQGYAFARPAPAAEIEALVLGAGCVRA